MSRITNFTFKAASPAVFVLTVIASLFGSILLIVFLASYEIIPKGNITIYVFFGVVTMFLPIYLTRLAAFAKVEVSLSKDSVSIKWLQHFLFNRRRDVTIAFKEIAEYVEQGDSNWYWLKIVLKDGTVYRIWNSRWVKMDDFGKFTSAFIHAVEHYNKSMENHHHAKNKQVPEPEIIQRAKTIYETELGLFLGVIGVIMIVVIPIVFFSSSENKTPNYLMIGTAYSGAIYFVIQVYKYRKRMKKED